MSTISDPIAPFDVEAAWEHLEFLFGTTDGFVALAYADRSSLDADGRPSWRERCFSWLDDFETLVESAQAALGRSQDVYLAPHPRRTRERKKLTGLDWGRVLWVDLDHDGEHVGVDRLLEAGAVLIDSGTAGHFHAYVPLKTPLPLAQIEILNRRLADALAGDHKWSNESLLRLAGTRNFKASEGGRPVQFVVPPSQASPFSVDEVLALTATAPVRESEAKTRGARGPGVPGEPDTSRSGVAWGRINSMLDAGATEDEVVQWFASNTQGEELRAHYRDEDHLRSDIARAWDKAALTDQKKGPSVTISTRDAVMAKTVAKRALRRFRWCAQLGWLRYQQGVWRSVSDQSVVEVIRKDLIDQHEREARAGADAKRLSALSGLLAIKRIAAMASLARGIRETRVERFDHHPDLLCVGNGVVDLTTGELIPHDPGLLFTKATLVDYVPGATHPDWDTALQAVPLEVADCLHVRFGQAATGHMTDDDKLPVLQGSGENGKTTLVSPVMQVLGEYAVLVPEKLLLANPGDHPTEVTTLRGARIALSEEAPEDHRLNVKRLKDTVGTPRLTARKLYKDNMTWDATHSLFLTTNYRLRINETDHGTWRRLALVRFPYRYVETPEGQDDRARDAGLRPRLLAGTEGQHQAVLAWLVQGAMRWYAAGMAMPPPPEQVIDDTQAWRREADLVMAFIGDELEFEPSAAVASSELFNSFTTWLTLAQHQRWGEQTFTERFGNHYLCTGNGVNKRRLSDSAMFDRGGGTTTHASRATAWLGVRYKTPTERRAWT